MVNQTSETYIFSETTQMPSTAPSPPKHTNYLLAVERLLTDFTDPLEASTAY